MASALSAVELFRAKVTASIAVTERVARTTESRSNPSSDFDATQVAHNHRQTGNVPSRLVKHVISRHGITVANPMMVKDFGAENKKSNTKWELDSHDCRGVFAMELLQFQDLPEQAELDQHADRRMRCRAVMVVHERTTEM